MKNFMQLGRSMVEMLGVLAIVGVLSIVGIYGYKKAMNKIHANELMDIAMKVYNQNLSRLTLNPEILNTNAGYLCSNKLPSSVTKNAAYVARCEEHNLGMERPSWALDSFNVIINLLGPTTHSIYIVGVGSCDVCEELKSMTEAGTTAYRIVSGSKKTPLTGGIKIFCLKSSNTDTGAANSNGSSLQCVF